MKMMPYEKRKAEMLNNIDPFSEHIHGYVQRHKEHSPDVLRTNCQKQLA